MFADKLRPRVGAKSLRRAAKQTSRSIAHGLEPLESRRLFSANPSIVDLLVVYTPAAETSAGGAAAIHDRIVQSIADTNQALVNSQINVTLRLVHAEGIAYTESGALATDLTRLQSPADGFMDSVAALRDTYGADLVSLFVNSGDTAGLGYVLTDPLATNNADFGFSVVQQQFAAGPNYTLAHEVGHNFGANHDRDNATSAGAYPYSYGYRFSVNGATYHDIMAFDPGTRIPYYSNPNITYQGVPIGIADDLPNAADNAHTINQTGPLVAAYRTSVVPDTQPPAIQLGAWDLSSNSQILTFAIKFTDDSAVDTSTLGTGDVVVTGPNNLTQIAAFLNVDQAPSGSIRTATYQVTRPTGPLAPGLYAITFQPNQVRDISGNFIPGNTALTLDTFAPSAVENATGITSEIGPTYTFTVTFADNVAVDVSTLDSSDIRVTGPNGYDRAATFLSIDTNSDGTPRIASYQISSSYTSWDGAENGTYTIVVQPNQVRDVNGNAVPAGNIGTFNVAIAGGTFATALDLGALSGTRIISDSVNSGDTTDFFKFTKAARGNFSLSLTNLSADANVLLVNDVNGNGAADTGEILAFPALAGTADESFSLALEAGVYFVWVYRFSGDTTYTLTLNSTADATIPTATGNFSALALSANGTATFTVIYADDTAMNVSSFGPDDLLINGPNGFIQMPAYVSVNNNSNGTPRQVTYRVSAPGGSWDPTDNGAYTVSVVAGQVADSSGNFVATGSIGNFNINISDTTAPAAALSASTITTAGAPTKDFIVTYTDNVAVNVGSLDSADLQITGPNGFSQFAAFLSDDSNTNGSPRSATYRISAPGGTWDALDNGTYTVTMRSHQVEDVAGNAASAVAIGSFQVAIADSGSPTAALSVTNITTPGAATQTFTVTYADDTAVNASTIDSSDIQVTGPNGFTQLATLLNVNVAGNGTPRTATYRINAPGGTWNQPDNGIYTISILTNQIADTQGNFIAAGALGTFNVITSDSGIPTATASATTITTAGAASQDIAVTYFDDLAINVATLDSADVQITGPHGFSQVASFVNVDSNTNGTPRVATYRISAPGGAWDFADTGTYTITLLANQVADSAGNAVVAGAIGSFQVNISSAGVPAATVNIGSLALQADGGATFTVIYSDDVAVKISTLDSGDLLITGPGGYSQVAAFVSVNNNSNGTPRQVTYHIIAPGGHWDATDNGAYSIAVQPSSVGDTQGNFVAAGTLGIFNINIPDTTAPTAHLSISAIDTAGGATQEFVVTYTDNVAINVATLDSSDIQITGPHGFSQIAAFISVDIDTNGPSRVVDYRIDAPGGIWDAADNGTYTVAIRATQVTDAAGNAVAAATLGTFTVNVPDTLPPVATLHATDLSAAGAQNYTFTVTYTDNVAVNPSTLDSSDLMVRFPDASDHPATFVSVDSLSNGTPRTATYRIAAPGGVFTHADNGTYTVSLVANQVADGSDNLMPAGALGSFQINIADTTAPTAIVSAPNITTAGATYTFTVTYTDNIALDASSFSSGDILITGPNGFGQPATFIDASPNSDGSPRNVTYQITGPGGTWDFADNGTYSLSVVASEVADTSGNFVAASALGTFQVNIADTEPPTATLKAAKVTKAGNAQYTFKVTYTDANAVLASSLGLGDIRVSAAHGFKQMARLVSQTPTGNAGAIVATYAITPPGGKWDTSDNRVYTIALLADQVRDTSNNAIPAHKLGTFTVNIAAHRVATAALPTSRVSPFSTRRRIVDDLLHAAITDFT